MITLNDELVEKGWCYEKEKRELEREGGPLPLRPGRHASGASSGSRSRSNSSGR